MGCSTCGGGTRTVSTRQSTSGRISTRTSTTAANSRAWTVTCPDGTESTVRGESSAHRAAAACGGTYSAK